MESEQLTAATFPAERLSASGTRSSLACRDAAATGRRMEFRSAGMTASVLLGVQLGSVRVEADSTVRAERPAARFALDFAEVSGVDPLRNPDPGQS